MNNSTKICTKCYTRKELTDFHKNKNKKDGHEFRCKKCINQAVKGYYKTVDGLITKIYGHQRESSKRRKHPMPDYTKQQFKKWLLSQSNFYDLYNYWVFYGYQSKDRPSPDRINDYKPYTLDNLRLVTWDENNKKHYADRKNGINNKHSKPVIGTHMETGKIVEFYSMHEAERNTGIGNSSIWKSCTGMQNSAGGYIWRYVE